VEGKTQQCEELRPVPLGPVVDLINSLTTRHFCAVLLRQVNAWLRVDRCALLRLGPGASIQAFGAQALEPMGARDARGLVAYLDRYHRFDPIRRLLDAAAIVVRRERAAELAPSGYRRACYDDPGVVDRLSLAKRDGRGGWVMLDLQRRSASGEFSERDCDAAQRLAPLLLAACLRHIELLLHAGADAGAWRARLAAACPSMTGRELDVAAQLLIGRTLRESAVSLGVAYSSVVTYCERAYSRLGVANLRELRGRFAAQRPNAA
jgi:DNA-binding CsgD family transcriptional regulator